MVVPYKTSLENLLEQGLPLFDLPLGEPRGHGNYVLEDFYPLLIAHAPPGPQFRVLRDRSAKTDAARVVHQLMRRCDFFAKFNARSVQKHITNGLAGKDLFEITDVFLKPPEGWSVTTGPSLQLVAAVDDWYLDSEDASKRKQPYNAPKMMARVLYTIQHNKYHARSITLPDAADTGLFG